MLHCITSSVTADLDKEGNWMEIDDNELHEALLGVILLLGDLRAKGLRHFLMKMKRGYLWEVRRIYWNVGS